MFAFEISLQQLAEDRSSCSADALAMGLKQLAGLRAALDACEAKLLGHFHRLGGCRRDGAVDQVAWLRNETGVSRRDAANRVQAAALLEQTPGVAEALASGEITSSHVEVLAKADAAVVAEHAEALIDRAQEMSADAFDRHVRTFVRDCSDDGGSAAFERQRRNRAAKLFTDDDGMETLVAKLDTVSYAIVTGALATIADELWDADAPLPLATRRADALVEMARRALAVDPSEAKLPVPSVTVLIDHQTLLGQIAASGGTCCLADGSPIAPATARRLACEAGVLPMVLGEAGLPLDVGRTHRLPTPAQRRALMVRDRGCVFPGCDRPPGWCEAHHLRPWEEGGPTDLANLALLCVRHHHMVHEDGWELRRDGHNRHVRHDRHVRHGRWRAVAPGGRVLTAEGEPCLLAV